jgi:hypothetical protein
MRVFSTLLFGIILAAGPAVVSSHAQTGQTPGEAGKTTKKSKAKHHKEKKHKSKEKTSS